MAIPIIGALPSILSAVGSGVGKVGGALGSSEGMMGMGVASSLGSLFTGLFGGSDLKDAANRAKKTIEHYTSKAQRTWDQQLGRGLQQTQPYVNMGNYLMGQLFGSGVSDTMQGKGQVDLGSQQQLDAYTKYKQAMEKGEYTTASGKVKKITPFAGKGRDSRISYYKKHRELLDPMLPRGSTASNLINTNDYWLRNAYPVDAYGNPFSEDLLQQYAQPTATYQGKPVGQGELWQAAGKSNLIPGMKSIAGPEQPPPGGNLLGPQSPAAGEGILGNMPGAYTPQVTPGPAPEMTPFDFAAFQESPWYQAPLQEAQRAMERSAIGRGGLYSGSFADALNKQMQDYAFSKYLPARTAEEATQQQAYNQWLKSQGLGMMGQEQAFNQWLTGQVNPSMNLLLASLGAAQGNLGALSGAGSGQANLLQGAGTNIANTQLAGAGGGNTNLSNQLGQLGGLGLGLGMYGMSNQPQPQPQSTVSPYSNLFNTGGNTGRINTDNFSLMGYNDGYNPLQGLFEERQFGGSVAAQQPYMVGEAGPELFVPQQQGTIVPNQMGQPMTPGVQAQRGQMGQPMSRAVPMTGQPSIPAQRGVPMQAAVPGMPMMQGQRGMPAQPGMPMFNLGPQWRALAGNLLTGLGRRWWQDQVAKRW